MQNYRYLAIGHEMILLPAGPEKLSPPKGHEKRHVNLTRGHEKNIVV